MDPVSLDVPEATLDSLPDDDGSAAADMRQAVVGLEAQLNRAIDDADDESEAASFAVDVVERLKDHYERYDEFVPELRAWGQSPIYAIAWRNLQASLVRQILDHEGLAAHVDRERSYRLVEDGIRFRKR